MRLAGLVAAGLVLGAKGGPVPVLLRSLVRSSLGADMSATFRTGGSR
ncbi:MAG: hypothetical protein QG622_3629 [Actinomycetota bacterium]|nr:hypothetical protein [Actinomycetota bacterium]